jgi:hypothetical protein
MPRIRTIKPEHWNDKQLPNISLQAHLLWIGTWNFSDDKGVFENDPILIRSQIFPRRTDVKLEHIQSWLDQLVKVKYIIPFTHNNENYFITRTFGVHQRIDKPQPSKIPDDVLIPFLECSMNDIGTVKERSALYSSVVYSNVEDSSVCADKPQKNTFTKPTVDAVNDYLLKTGCEEKTARLAAENFYDYYESNGWKVGRNHMKDWQAAARNWKKNLKTFNNGTNHKSPTGNSKSAGAYELLEETRNLYGGGKAGSGS